MTASLDRTTISTELNTTEQIKVTVDAEGGYTGQVMLAATVTDTSGNPLTGWTVSLDHSSFDITADGTQVATATLMIPSQNMALVGNVGITVTSSLGSIPLTSAVTAANQITFNVTANGTQCAYPSGTNQATPTKVNVGTKLIFVNMTTFTIVIHSNGGNDGIAHQDLAGMGPNGMYEQTLSSATTSAFSWYCHSPGPDNGNNDPFVQAMP